MATKVLALTDALDNLACFGLLTGHRSDEIVVAPLIEGVEFEALSSDKAYDANILVKELNQRRAKVVISQHPGRAQRLTIDAEMCQWRHLV